jgi:hypothetical protein
MTIFDLSQKVSSLLHYPQARRPSHARHHDSDRNRRLRGLERAARSTRQEPIQVRITDGAAYQDLDTDGAALFHIRVEDVDTAMQWFRSDTFKDASKLAKVTGRRFYLAQPQSN